jgi:predicted dehydrogenase
MKVTVLGRGFMGATHVKAWASVPGVTLVDTEAEADAVDICLPTDMHAPATIAALRAGKHVLVEKPMALDFASAESMRSVADEVGRTLMVGQVLRFVPAYRALAEWMKGRKIESAIFRRQCGVPAWNGWFRDFARSGGPVLDLLIHDMDFCISLWGMPKWVRGTELHYPGIGRVVIEGGWHDSPDYPFSMEFVVEAEDGTLARKNVEVEDAFEAELKYFTDCVQQGKEPEFCPPAQSAQAVALARFILESRENNGKVVRTS